MILRMISGGGGGEKERKRERDCVCVCSRLNMRACMHVCVFVPGNIEEDEALYVRQLDFLFVHLQAEMFVEVPGVTQLLEPHFHIHTLVMEPGNTHTQSHTH